MWADIKGEVQNYELKKRLTLLTLHYIQEVDMLRKCRHV